ncbi:response regulator transcription factor [bacterium]|nr:response regulator transcription factor [bacterium]
MKKLVAVIDDEPDIVELVSIHLHKASFDTAAFHDAGSFLQSLTTQVPHLIVLDLMLPDADGYELCRNLKASGKFASIPIIMLTAKSEETDKVLGLELGADDYVTKPFSPRELVARVKAVLRRQRIQQESKQTLIGDHIVVDANRFEVTVDGERIDLTSTEFRILHLLSQRKGWVYSREQILEHLWGHDKAVLDRTVDVHIKNIREKLGAGGAHIKNVRGVGYKVDE